MNGPWHKADFGPDNIIPPRNCFVAKGIPRLQAYLEISEWVREQGVAIGEINVKNCSFSWLKLWDQIPQNCSQVGFQKLKINWVYYQYF